MLLSRGAPFLRQALFSPSRPAARVRMTNVRHSGDGFLYRGVGDEPGSAQMERYTDYAYTVFWYWVWYNVLTKYEHLTGEYPWPDASSWTDEELGVPPDNYEPPSRN